MKKYHDLAERARSAALTRRRKDAELKQLIIEGLSTPAELQAGKVAENSDANNGSNSHEMKAPDDATKGGCPVDPITTPATHIADRPTSHLRDLIKTPDVQGRIKAGKAQRKRDETRKATMQHRVAMPVTPWKRAAQDEKFRYAGHAAEHAGGQAFSLNLSERVQKKLRRHHDPLRAFTDTLNRELMKQGLAGMPYALALEHSSKEKLHVHGFLIPPSGAEEAVRRALRGAGGTIPGKAGSRQLTFKALSGAAGWAFYCAKGQEHTDEVLEGDARLFVNRTMTQVAREFSVSAN